MALENRRSIESRVKRRDYGMVQGQELKRQSVGRITSSSGVRTMQACCCIAGSVVVCIDADLRVWTADLFPRPLSTESQ